MPDYVATVLAALIGALLGSVGAVFAEFWLSGRSREKQARKQIAQKYLYQLQDATESLWFRIDNLAVFHREMVQDSYFEITTMYAFGRVMACERLLGLDGIYPLLHDTYPGLTEIFRNQLSEAMRKLSIKEYDRIAIAEALLVSENDRLRVGNYLEFSERFSDSAMHKWLAPLQEAVPVLNLENDRDYIAERLCKVSFEIANRIGVKCSLPVDNCKS